MTPYSGTRTVPSSGVGLAFAVSEQLVTHVEYRYSRFGTKAYSTPLQNGITNSKLSTHKLMLGISYKFGGSLTNVFGSP